MEELLPIYKTTPFLSIPTKQEHLIYSIVSGNRCGLSSIVQLTVNVANCNREISGKQVNIYPNPTDNFLQIEVENAEKVRYELHNKYSQKIFSGEFVGKQSLSTQNLPQDVYFLHLHYPDGSIERRQIVVQR
jgi:hypothetical protein